MSDRRCAARMVAGLNRADGLRWLPGLRHGRAPWQGWRRPVSAGTWLSFGLLVLAGIAGILLVGRAFDLRLLPGEPLHSDLQANYQPDARLAVPPLLPQVIAEVLGDLRVPQPQDPSAPPGIQAPG
ncbi:MAG TPA: hypothetical protein VGE07_11205, partial [Herpetosiphonaceae bacterium]